MNDAISRISAMESLIELYRDPCSKKAVLIRTVPTLSHRRTSATKCLNELLQERPDMANTVYALLTYPVQKWAQKVRKSIGIDAQMNDALENSFLDTVRVTKELCSSSDVQPRIGDNRAVRLAESDAIIGVIEEAVQWLSETPSIGGKLAHALRAIHFMEQDAEDLSANEFRKYYRPAIIYLHDRYCDDIDRNVCQLTSSGWLYSGNTYSDAYHNTVLLVSIYSYLLHRYERRSHTGLSDQSIQRDADGLMLLKTFEDAMYALKRYRADGEVLFAIIHSLSNGKSDRETKAQLGMSNRSFYEKKVLAINLLSFILWGYSTLTILEGVSAYPLSKKDIQMLEQRIDQKKNDTAADHF